MPQTLTTTAECRYQGTCRLIHRNAGPIRSRAMAGLGFLGVREDAGRNTAGTGDREIGMPEAPVRSLVIAAREDIEIARQVREVLRAPR
jgi:acetate kinase